MAASARPAPVILEDDEKAILGNAVRDSASEGPVRVLEAGCGKRWNIAPGIPVTITGIDQDAEALRIRQEEKGDLDAVILGDLRTVELPENTFDVAYCSYVLEHVPGAEAVLDKLAAAVRPRGRLLVRVPDGESVFGFLAKHTPHRTHVWFKKYVERHPHAGEPGYAPYPTVYDRAVSLSGMRRWAQSRGLTIETEYATNGYMRSFGVFRPLVEFGLRVISFLSGGRLAYDHNNIGFVLSKPGIS